MLNGTTVPGLAARAAQRLESGGWTVTGVGNFRGSVVETTVYYPPGLESAAAAAAADLPGADRIRPRFANLSTTRLTVVIASDYAP